MPRSHEDTGDRSPTHSHNYCIITHRGYHFDRLHRHGDSCSTKLVHPNPERAERDRSLGCQVVGPSQIRKWKHKATPAVRSGIGWWGSASQDHCDLFTGNEDAARERGGPPRQGDQGDPSAETLRTATNERTTREASKQCGSNVAPCCYGIIGACRWNTARIGALGDSRQAPNDDLRVWTLLCAWVNGLGGVGRLRELHCSPVFGLQFPVPVPDQQARDERAPLRRRPYIRDPRVVDRVMPAHSTCGTNTCL